MNRTTLHIKIAELLKRRGNTVRYIHHQSGWWIFKRTSYRYLWIDDDQERGCWQVWRSDRANGSGRIPVYAINVRKDTGARHCTSYQTFVYEKTPRGGALREVPEYSVPAVWNIVARAIEKAWEQHCTGPEALAA